MMEHAIDFAYLNSMKKINLTSVYTAVEFYKKMGFHIIYETNRYDHQDETQNYPMSKTLNSGVVHEYVDEEEEYEEEDDDKSKRKKNVGGRRRNTQNKIRKPLLHHQTQNNQK